MLYQKKSRRQNFKNCCKICAVKHVVKHTANVVRRSEWAQSKLQLFILQSRHFGGHMITINKLINCNDSINL